MALVDGEKSEEEQAEKAPEDTYYDKKSSFFDRISCEALEKAEGKSGRPDWKKERETNQETFGHSAVRSLNYRRGFGQRGRARGYGRKHYYRISSFLFLSFNKCANLGELAYGFWYDEV
ncbi:FFD and TFG box motif protein [Ostertagia ostertagi]